MYNIGDRIVYPSIGVGQIQEIVTRIFGESEKLFYKVKVDEKHAQLMIPVDSAERIGLRPLVGSSTAQKLFKVFGEVPDSATFKAWSKKFRTFEERLKSGDPFEVAEVLRDLLMQAHRKELSFGEKKVLEQARSLLIRELAFSMDSEEDTIMAKLKAKVEKVWETLPKL